jgi:hypothetical protein
MDDPRFEIEALSPSGRPASHHESQQTKEDMDYRDRMMNGQRVGDCYAERSSRTLDEINARQRRDQTRANGGMTGGDAIVALIVMGFRKMPRPVRRVVLTAVLARIGPRARVRWAG